MGKGNTADGAKGGPKVVKKPAAKLPSRPSALKAPEQKSEPHNRRVKIQPEMKQIGEPQQVPALEGLRVSGKRAAKRGRALELQQEVVAFAKEAAVKTGKKAKTADVNSAKPSAETKQKKKEKTGPTRMASPPSRRLSFKSPSSSPPPSASKIRTPEQLAAARARAEKALQETHDLHIAADKATARAEMNAAGLGEYLDSLLNDSEDHSGSAGVSRALAKSERQKADKAKTKAAETEEELFGTGAEEEDAEEEGNDLEGQEEAEEEEECEKEAGMGEDHEQEEEEEDEAGDEEENEEQEGGGGGRIGGGSGRARARG